MADINIRNPMRVLYNVLDSIIKKSADINVTRANYSNVKQRQYVFPQFPESNDENYPRYSITFKDARFVDYGAGQFVQDVENDEGNIVSTQYGKYLSIPIKIGIWVKKDQIHQIETANNEQVSLKNQALADSLALQLHRNLSKYRKLLIDERFDYEGEIVFTPAYDDNHFLFAASVDFDLITLDVWDESYSVEQLIATINYTQSIELS